MNDSITVMEKSQIKSEEIIGLELPTIGFGGFGKWHTNKPGAETRVAYTPLTFGALNDIEDPNKTHKDYAKWMIFSSWIDPYSREHEQQRQHGLFHALWADLDKMNNKTFENTVEIVKNMFKCKSMLYTTSSATKENQKCRLIIPLKNPCSGYEFEILQKILNDKFINAGIEPDHASERAGQICFLPNKGEFYRYKIIYSDKSFDHTLWCGEIESEKPLKIEFEKKKAIKKVSYKNKEFNLNDPIEAYKQYYPVDIALEEYGYKKIGNKYLSPNSKSETPGVSILEGDNRWYSHHSSDSKIGKKGDVGTSGDAFDLYVHYEHNGNFKAGVAAAAELFNISKKDKNKKEKINFVPNFSFGADLMKQDFDPINWVIPGILSTGLAILAGKPKMGKSILSLNLALALATGTPFGSDEAATGKVIYLALEDTKRRLKDRMVKMSEHHESYNNIMLETTWPKSDQGGLEYLEEVIKKTTDLKLIIIDTLKMFTPAKTQGSAYDQDYDNLVPIKELADKYDICIMLVHHLRKTQSDDVMDDISGTFGVSGTADTLLVVVRKTNEEYAELHGTGRDIDSFKKGMEFKKDKLSWEFTELRTDFGVNLTDIQTKIYDVIFNQNIKPDESNEFVGLVTAKEIYKKSKINKESLKTALKALVNKKIGIEKVKNGYTFMKDQAINF